MTATYVFDLADHRGNVYFAIYKKIVFSIVRMGSFWAYFTVPVNQFRILEALF
jgi:hypothetical protein